MPHCTLQAQGQHDDRTAKLRKEAKKAFSETASHKECEKAVRVIGAAFGFDSSRPDTDFGKGPDNLWIDTYSKQMIAFELKTDKASDSSLNKEDIGQGHNHIEWLKTQYSDLTLLGLIFLTPADKVSEKSDPSDTMYFGSPEQLEKIWNDFFTVIDRIKTKSPLEKIAEASKTGELPEWKPSGLFKRLTSKKCKSSSA